MKKTFVSYFGTVHDKDYMRDPIMIPFCAAKYYGFESSLITVKQENVYEHFNTYLPELKLIFINNEDEIYDYLKAHGKTIDVLLIMFLSSRTSLRQAECYKKINPLGKVYIKCDMSLQGAVELSNHSLKNIIKRMIIKSKLKKYVDLVSIETTAAQKVLKEVLGVNVKYIPNGFYDFDKTDDQKIGDKKKEILTVGALGTEVKNTYLLVNAYKKSEAKKRYVLRLVGNYTEELYDYIEQIKLEEPELKTQIILQGPVYERTELMSLYRDALVFVLPSRYESFGIVLVEAARYGDFIISTKQVAAFDDVTDHGRFGVNFGCEDENGLTEIFDSLDVCLQSFNALELQKYALNFEWKRIVERILRELYGESFSS